MTSKAQRGKLPAMGERVSDVGYFLVGVVVVPVVVAVHMAVDATRMGAQFVLDRVTIPVLAWAFGQPYNRWGEPPE